VTLFIELGERRGIAYTRGQMADIELMEGNLAEAQRLAREADRICAETADRHGLVLSAGRLAEIAIEQKRYSVAAQRLRSALESAEELNDYRTVLGLLETAARLAAALDKR